MKKIVLLLMFLTTNLLGQVKVLSWNIQNLGKSKSEEELAFITKTIKEYDIVAIQEVVAGAGGAQTVAKLADALNRSGSKWDYTVSDPTTSSAYKTERYAYLWKTAVVKQKGTPWLEEKYNKEIDREPYYCTFTYQKKEFTLVNFHAITKSKQPETEIKYFKYLPECYPDLNLVFMGDFNCPQSHTVFNPLRKMNYLPVLVKQKTSLKMECKESVCLASEFDNIWYNSKKISVKNAKIIPFYESFTSLELARKISDHVPVVSELYFL